MSSRSIRIIGGPNREEAHVNDANELFVTQGPNVIDPRTGFVTTIGESHRMIHDGYLFDATGILPVLAAGAVFDVLMQFPVGVVGHLTNVEYQFENTPVTIEFFEDVTWSAAGTAALVTNKNRLVAPTPPGAIITEGPTITDTGDLIHQRFIPSGGTKTGILVPGEELEWVLGNGKDYIWRVTNNTNGDIKLGYHFNGYELP